MTARTERSSWTSPDRFVGCSVHNYREFMGGFTDWAQTIADSEDAADFRSRVSDSDNASMWQSLSFKANYKAAYCLAVCPAGEDVIEPFLDDRKGFMDLVLKPLQEKRETLYVLPNSEAKEHAEKRYPTRPSRWWTAVSAAARARVPGGVDLRSRSCHDEVHDPVRIFDDDDDDGRS